MNRAGTDKAEDDKNWLAVFGCMALIPAVIGTGVCLGLLKAWVVHVCWGWFVTPVFAIAAPSVALCFGLMLIVSIVRQGFDRTKKEDGGIGKTFALLASQAVGVLISLAIAYLVHLFV